MRQPKNLEPSRRKFLGIVPACAVACMGCSNALAIGKSKSPDTNITMALQEDVHPFDEEPPRKLSWRQLMRIRYYQAIMLGKWMIEDMGHDEALEYLKKFTAKSTFDFGKQQAARSTNQSFSEFTDQFKNNPNIKNTLVMEIVEDTETAFEIKVTECLWASTFLDNDAGELGFALVCHGDYAHAEGFNSKIKLVRDKTLMQGDSICNHHYIWQE